ncbi:uncharacterized protein DUF4148 [Paraburkholderia rhizosphaerae]|uniref:Uncharacterized protein DUF4148 n=2 Tax=Paraburkholderia rhizosphaerae TaxID=480658 RepID=A0A4R8M011_9BURK|nr:DUF4148 domain-containing protein [Paraburkholderia rhizosphaerae]TDY54599.1 uncharacterized protein DUF4148 [Paraburkholderia rhizosphaerae]
MKKFAMFAMALAAFSSANVFAQGKTRAEVYQELVQAKQNGLDFVTDTSYPDVAPMFQPTVAYLKQKALAKNAQQNGHSTANADTSMAH